MAVYFENKKPNIVTSSNRSVVPEAFKNDIILHYQEVEKDNCYRLFYLSESKVKFYRVKLL